jgi:hypothetical protein
MCEHLVMRSLVVVTVCLLLAACSSAGSDEKPPAVAATSASEPTPSAEPSTSEVVAETDPCELLTSSEIKGLSDGTVSEGRPASQAGMSSCSWPAGNSVVQVLSGTSSDWARSLPAAVAALEASGQITDPKSLQQLAQIRDLVGTEGALDPVQACDAFSQILEIQGRAPGRTTSVTVSPSKADPQSLIAQRCNDGRFTAVTISNPASVQGTLPVKQVTRALANAHQRAVG